MYYGTDYTVDRKCNLSKGTVILRGCKMEEINVKRLKLALGIERKIVGVHFFDTKKAFSEDMTEAFLGKRSVCGMVRLAQEGVCVKASSENFGCSSGGEALGVLERGNIETEDFILEASGLYRDPDVVKSVSRGMCKRKSCFGVLFAPLEKMTAADVVILIVNARQAMRLVQGYSYYYGTSPDFKTVGNQAACSDLIARPYVYQNMNISFLCRGTRVNMQALDGELGVAMPAVQFGRVAEGVIETLSFVESESKKNEILDRLDDPMALGREVEMHTSYMKRMEDREKELASNLFN